MKDRDNKRRKTLLWIAIAAAALIVLAVVLRSRTGGPHRSPIQTVQIRGAVLRQNKDPRKQAPIANAAITTSGSLFEVTAKSDASGFFQLFVRPGLRSTDQITLSFEHDEYKPMEITWTPEDRLYIVRMEPVVPEPGDRPSAGTGNPLPLRDVRVRYIMKNQTTMTVGSLAKQFDVVNTGNVPCVGHKPCSPDGKWKAATGSLSLDAEDGNQFRNVRITCIAGPCPFTANQSGDLTSPSRLLGVSVLNWSDTATFLVEAEVTRTAVTDTVRRSYPTIIGQTMTFALPAAAEGTTVEANLNGEEIVFPLGPRLILSWATCSVETAPGQNKTYRCELKSGYQFPE